VKSVAGAEDDETEGARAVAQAGIGANDVVIGIAASGTTPFTIGVLRAASAVGAVTVAVANNPEAPLFLVARHRIAVETGTEVIAGSTRMKAGTAQKIVVNLFSTSIMVKLGRVYRGLMVDMRARNAKLRRRAESIVSRIVGCSEPDAERLVNRSEGDVKIAILLGFGLAATEAAEVLRRHGGNLRLAINGMNERRAQPAGRKRRRSRTRAVPPKGAGSGKLGQSRQAPH
jgi:N-acetylmuramic acid 6-phosphate etherase